MFIILTTDLHRLGAITTQYDPMDTTLSVISNNNYLMKIDREVEGKQRRTHTQMRAMEGPFQNGGQRDRGKSREQTEPVLSN